MLYLLNFLVWFFPIFLFKGINKIFVFIIVYLFSQSYWIYPFSKDFFDLSYYSIVLEHHIDTVLLYSIYSGLAFNFSILLINGKYVFSKPDFQITYNIRLLNFFTVVLFLRFIVFLVLFYVFFMALNDTGGMDRREFLSYNPSWYSVFLPIAVFIVVLIQFYDFFRLKNSFDFFHYVTFFQIFLIILIYGYDGSRREIFLLLFPMFFFMFKYLLDPRYHRNSLKVIYILVFFGTVSSILSLNRLGTAGWSFILQSEFMDVVKGSVYLFSPMSTLHVNTQMLEYVQNNGYQGVGNYLRAIGNFIFPNFIFGGYIFGDPLVLKIHRELGWHGMDFGFMAEAIYSGGISMVIFMHASYGLFVGFFLKLSAKNKLISILFIFFIMVGAVNSLRSDFMNLLKTTLYFPIFIYFMYYLYSKFFAKRGSVK